ncbi:hypothetical protein DPMN_066586 [Dreissena polymorpha]|uniref:Uncharacterized protein n=1 Tax=Dreissena polymorpha TaxID=45954 RepID=A0A9D3YZA0_DREPO|nr:hypothetical protein DPMN_066586 [Dreissena polymorpha]
MAAPMNITRNSVVLTLLLVLTTVFVINILQCIKLKYHEQPSIAISITLKCSRINLINNFANLKPKLRRNSIAFPVSVEDVNKTTLLVLLLIIAGAELILALVGHNQDLEMNQFFHAVYVNYQLPGPTLVYVVMNVMFGTTSHVKT